MSEQPHPIEGQIVLLAGAQASVTLQTLSVLLSRVQEYIFESRADYRRRFECIEGETTVYSLIASEQWHAVAEELGLTEAEVGAVKRAHEAQFRRDGRRLDRTEEFETMLEIRQPLAIGSP